jgi:hypothetical protein
MSPFTVAVLVLLQILGPAFCLWFIYWVVHGSFGPAVPPNVHTDYAPGRIRIRTGLFTHAYIDPDKETPQ